MKIKKALALALTAGVFLTAGSGVFAAGTSSVTGHASVNAAAEFEGDFNVVDGVLKGYRGSGGDVVIPEGVREISEYVFQNNYNLTGITFSDTVETIDAKAFKGCLLLEHVTFSHSVKTIGNEAFSGCGSLRSIVIPDNVTSIGSQAFAFCGGLTSVRLPETMEKLPSLFFNCKSLTGITLPKSLKEIEGGAFACCNSLKSITIPGTVTTIGEYAFRECTSLTGVVIPASVTRLRGNAFSQCTGITAFKVASGNPNYSSQDGAIYNKDKSELVAVPCSRKGAFIIPNFVNSVGEYAFMYCHDMTSVTIPDSVQKIGFYSFYGCSGLTEVTIPASVTDISKDAFGNCGSIQKVYFKGTQQQWEEISAKAEASVGFGSSVRYYYDYSGSVPLSILTQPESVIIEPGESVTLSVEAEGELPLTYQWYYLKSGDETWSKWSGRTHATETVTPNETWNGIRLYCKVKDSSGRSIRSDIVTVLIFTDEEMEEIASDSCGDNLKWSLDQSTGTLTITGSGDMWDYMYEGFLFAPWSFDYDNFEFTADQVKKVVFSGNITSIGDSAFALCSNLSAVTIPGSVRTIGNQAFAGTGLTKITIPASVSEFGYDVFADGILFVDENSTVGGVSRMTAITVDSANRYYSSVGGVMFDKAKTELVCYPLAKQGAYTVPDTVQTIGAYAFSDAEGLTGVTIPASVRTIGVEAFSYCTGLGSVTLPEGVVTIDDGAFFDAGLSSIRIPKSVETIGYLALNNTDDEMENLLPIRDIYYAGSSLAWSRIKTSGEYDDDFSFRDYLKGANLHFAEQSTEITSQPESQTVSIGDTLTVSVGAQGEGLSYQWYYKKAGQTSWTLWNNRTHASETVTPNATWDGIRLYCEVKDADGNVLKSEPARITVVIPSIRITGQPEDQSVYLGSTMTLSVGAEGKNLRYQWYFKKAGQTSFTKWNGRTHATETVTPNATWDGIKLYCEITDGAGGRVCSDEATVTVTEAKIKITSQPTSQNITLGDTIKLSVRAEGEGIAYQWYFRKSGQTSFTKWNNRTHATETVTPNATWNGIQLYCEIKDGSGNVVTSNTVTVTVTEPNIKITSQPANQSIALGGTIKLTVKAEGEGLSYQWYFKKAGQTSFTKWNGRTRATETVTPNSTWDGIQLYCEVKDASGHSVKSDTVTVTVTEAKIKITSQPVSQSITLGDTVNLTVKAEGEGLSYQWYFKKAGQTSFTKWNGRNHATETVTPNATWNGIQLYCEITDGAGNSVKSDVVKITIK